jgi:ribosomal protein L33
MAWQKTKILLLSVIEDKDGKKHVSRYETNKSKGKGKPNQNKLAVMKFHKILRRHTLHKETKYK